MRRKKKARRGWRKKKRKPALASSLLKREREKRGDENRATPSVSIYLFIVIDVRAVSLT
jgi:hypothetical protein